MTALRAVLTAAPAAAAPEGVEAIASFPEADQLIRQGLELRRAGKSHEAVDLFRRAHNLAFTPRALGQLALAEASAGIWLDAETHLVTALELGTDAWVRRNREMLSGALEIVRQHIGELVVTGPSRTEITVDGRPVGSLPLLAPLHVPEGSALVTATGMGFAQFSKTVFIQPGARVALAIVPEPKDRRPTAAMAPPVRLTAQPHASHAIWAGGALLATGAGLATWGAIWIIVDDGHRDSGAGSSCGTNCSRVYDTRTWGMALAVGGAAAIAGGVALIVSGPHQRTGDPDIALAVSPAAVGVRGRF